MDHSPFANLPAELREQVYELVLCDATERIISLSDGRPRLIQPDDSRPLAIIQTCEQIRHESLPVFFRGNHFVLRTDHIKTFHKGYGLRTSWLASLKEWLDCIGDHNRCKLRNVDIDIELWESHPEMPRSIVFAGGRTAELVWGSLLPALRLFDRMTDLHLRCLVRIVEGCRVGNRELRLSLRGPETAEDTARSFFACDDRTTGGRGRKDERLQECLKMTEMAREVNEI